jgi:tRNA modification GTPase
LKRGGDTILLIIHFILSRDELKSCLAHTEAVIDFGDDDRENDVNDDAMWALVPRVKALRDLIHNSLSDDKKGEILRDGVQITLLGLPNAGSCSSAFLFLS